MKLREGVQPAEAARDGEHGESPSNGRPQHPPRDTRRFSWHRLGLLLLCLVWIGFGIHGAFSYGQAYYTYRGFEPPKDPPGISPGRLTLERFYSPALKHERSFNVYLPPGYAGAAAAGRRFPVLYLLHGSPGGASLLVNAGAVGVKLDQLVAGHVIPPYLIVIPNGGNGTFRHDTEWADTRKGRFESFVLDVVRTVDARFPTLPKRQYRAIAGLSEGAYGALNIALRHLPVFGVVGSWSGYFLQRPVGPFEGASPATLWANSPTLYVPQLTVALHRLPLHVYMYFGRQEKIVPRARRFARELGAAGADVKFAVYPGHHDWQLWRRHMNAMLEYAAQWFWPRPSRGHLPYLAPHTIETRFRPLRVL